MVCLRLREFIVALDWFKTTQKVNMEIKNIEKFFLNTILSISIMGVLLILASDILFFPEDTLSLSIDISILSACIVAYLLRVKHPTVAVLTVTSIALVTMLYQCLVVPANTTTSLSVILIVGFIFSIMLKDKLMWVMHLVAAVLLASVFVVQYINPDLRFSENLNDLITVAITYFILYFILTYGTAMVKSSYDRIHLPLNDTNIELSNKANEIANQNIELLRIQGNLSALNKDLEKIVNERTARIQTQNEILIKYSYTNAHHLRGPVARLLGLAKVYKIEVNPDPDYFIGMMVDQAHQIDSVIKQINIDLTLHNVEIKDSGSNS